MQIDDGEFEWLLEKMLKLWPKHDTVDMAKLLQTSEAKTAYVLSCMMDGNYIYLQEEK